MASFEKFHTAVCAVYDTETPAFELIGTQSSESYQLCWSLNAYLGEPYVKSGGRIAATNLGGIVQFFVANVTGENASNTQHKKTFKRVLLLGYEKYTRDPQTINVTIELKRKFREKWDVWMRNDKSEKPWTIEVRAETHFAGKSKKNAELVQADADGIIHFFCKYCLMPSLDVYLKDKESPKGNLVVDIAQNERIRFKWERNWAKIIAEDSRWQKINAPY
jgi:hypothetical protein